MQAVFQSLSVLYVPPGSIWRWPVSSHYLFQRHPSGFNLGSGPIANVEWNVTLSRSTVVWLVDDAASVRKSIRAVLETSDFTVRDFSSAKEFLADFRSGPPVALLSISKCPK